MAVHELADFDAASLDKMCSDSRDKLYQIISYGAKELEVEIDSDSKSDFEIANYIMYHTMLPR